jgi:Zn finger protein HypA/HybF involved in hydrogenase expression
MEGVATKQVRYGKSCNRCRTYFISERQNEYTCPWCQRIEAGAGQLDVYETEDDPLP